MPVQKRLAEIGVYLNYAPGEFSVPDGTLINAPTGAYVEPFAVFVARTIFRSGFSGFFASPLSPTINIGRYCSIAVNVRIMGQDHPLDWITTNGFAYRHTSNAQVQPALSMKTDRVKMLRFDDIDDPTIGHDVWIGQDVLLRRGITLGNGSVVAGGSVVVKDVPPFAIVGGNPARLIRYRFQQKLIERIEKAAWWDYAFPHFGDLPFNRPEIFLDDLESRIETGSLKPYRPKKIDVYNVIVEHYQLVPASFDEGAYLRQNPDIDAAVREGRIRSGRQHYAKHGRSEGRKLGT